MPTTSFNLIKVLGALKKHIKNNPKQYSSKRSTPPLLSSTDNTPIELSIRFIHSPEAFLHTNNCFT